METNELQSIVYSQYAKEYASIIISKEERDTINQIMPHSLLSNKNWYRFIKLATKFKWDNDVVDYYMSLPEKREQGELFSDYQERRKFKNFLIRNRSRIYNHDAKTQI